MARVARLCAALMTLVMPALVAQDEALALYLPFDGDLGQPVVARHTEFEPGRIGQAVHLKYGGELTGSLGYDVARLMDPRQGTLAFWVRTAVDLSPATALGRVIDLHSEEDVYFNVWMRISVKGKGDFTVDVVDDSGGRQSCNYTEALQTWKANAWHHLAVVWDCSQGLRVYDDGREVFSSWGKASWEPLTPTLLGLGCVAGQPVQADLRFDDLRLYTEVLDAEQVAALAKGEDVRVPQRRTGPPGATQTARRLRSEVEGQAGLPVIAAGRPATVRQVLVEAARINRVTHGALVDGRSRGQAPGSGPIEARFVAPARITHVALDGADTACLIGGQPVGGGRVARLALPAPLTAGTVRLEAREAGPKLTEVRFHERVDGWLGEAAAAGPEHALPATTAPVLESVTPPVAADLPIGAVSLRLVLAEPLPALARLELTEAAERGCSLFAADVRITGTGDLRLTLDWPDYVLRAGGQLVLRLTCDPPATIQEGSFLRLHAVPLNTARREYVIRQLAWFRPWYSIHAEAHVWDSKGWQPETMPELRWLDNVRHVDPANPLATAYYNRIFHQTAEVDVTIPGPDDAPLWARAQREAMRRSADVVHWWIDQRQSPDGQFGGNWNDDVEMLHGWDLLVLGAGDVKVRDSMARLCDGIWAAGRFTKGYSNLIWDVEHAAEDSTYSQPRMVPLEYGNPKWLERCMETSANIGFWTEVNAQGHRHFKGYMFQAQAFRPGPETDSDVPDNARAAKIGLYVGWYNGNETLTTWFRQWADAWCEDALRPVPGKPAGVLPGEIVAKTCQIGRDGSRWDTCKRYPLGAITYHMEDQLVGTYLLTGERRYLAPVEAMVLNGRGSEASQVNWRRLTGDTRRDAAMLELAARGRPTPGFLAWLATGDKEHLAQACIEVVRDFERNRFLITEAEPPTDRVPMPGNVLLRQMLLGGIGVWVCGWPQMAVSWEDTGLDFAGLVLESRPNRLRVLAQNFGPERRVVLRVWELERGLCELRVGADRNQDDSFDVPPAAQTVAVDRAARLPIQLAAGALTLIELRQVERRPAGRRPDLGIGAEDITLSADRRAVTVRVHSLGGMAAPATALRLENAAGQTLAEAPVPALLPPEDLVPKTADMVVSLAAPLAPRWAVVLDPAGTLDEITRENNRVVCDK